jgi:hypothetical protein
MTSLKYTPGDSIIERARTRDEALSQIYMTYSFHGIFRAQLPAESRLTRYELFRQTASMEAELDCGLQSNSR